MTLGSSPVPRRHVRLRADPSKVRVSIRRWGSARWACTVASLVEPREEVVGWDETPAGAIDRALTEADDLGMPGIDLGMERAYDHPFWSAS